MDTECQTPQKDHYLMESVIVETNTNEVQIDMCVNPFE